MSWIVKRKYISILLSMLFLASTASVRSSLAAGSPPPTETPAPSEALITLAGACEGPNLFSSDSAAYAAIQLRYEAGYISSVSPRAHMTQIQQLNASFNAADRLIHTMIAPDWQAWQATLVDFDPASYDSYAENVSVFSALADTLDGEIQQSSAACVKSICRDLRIADIPIKTGGTLATRLDWRECAALYYALGEEMENALADAISVERTGDTAAGVSLNWPNPAFEDIAAGGTHDQLVEAILAFDYFNTVYNDDGTTAPVEIHIFSKEYLATVAHPVPGGVIKNGWYDPRSHRTRLHVGTDIRMRAKTPILSATDGVVKYIGYLPIPGYYVMIEDSYGYTYHYYHMYELTTFVREGDAVRQGQQIGIVGSTGNSVAYHLHFGVVSPEGKYLNPYDLFLQAGIGPILKDG